MLDKANTYILLFACRRHFDNGLLKRIKIMVIIKTKFISPTNNRGSRIQASANGFKNTIPYPYEVSNEYCHFKAVQALIVKHGLDWNLKDIRYGSDENGDYFFAFDSSKLGSI